MSDAYLLKLIDWYHHQCNGSWEKVFGIKIRTIDNPGFNIDINLKDTKLEEKSFKDIFIDKSDDDWLVCKLENGLFQGPSGIFNFQEVLQRFIEWSDDNQKIELIQKKFESNGILDWLIDWYYNQCDGDWEHGKGIRIETLANPGWEINITIEDTELECKNFQQIKIENSKADWLFCQVKNGLFTANCATYNLLEVLEIFKNWVEAI